MVGMVLWPGSDALRNGFNSDPRTPYSLFAAPKTPAEMVWGILESGSSPVWPQTPTLLTDVPATPVVSAVLRARPAVAGPLLVRSAPALHAASPPFFKIWRQYASRNST